jgi:phosphoribosylamine--glycine ligase
MGAVSPSGLLPAGAMRLLEGRVMSEVITPAVRTLAGMGRPFRGVLYAGLMVRPDGAISVLEFNVRLGDPETQAILIRLRSDLAETLASVAAGRLAAAPLLWDPRPAVCVVVAADGYPQGPRTGMAVEIPERALLGSDVALYHAGTRRDESGTLRVAGGRVFGCTALGASVAEARDRAYALARAVRFDGARFRGDIAANQEDRA